MELGWQVGQGVTSPWKIQLSDADHTFHGAYKLIKKGEYSGYRESF